MSAKILQFPNLDRARRAPNDIAQPQSCARSFSQEVRAESFWDFCEIILDLLTVGAITPDHARREIEKFVTEQGGNYAQN